MQRAVAEHHVDTIAVITRWRHIHRHIDHTSGKTLGTAGQGIRLGNKVVTSAADFTHGPAHAAVVTHRHSRTGIERLASLVRPIQGALGWHEQENGARIVDSAAAETFTEHRRLTGAVGDLRKAHLTLIVKDTIRS